ncbi:hypothetical protein [Tropicimonas isoalkanivorans]|uniref:LPS sulfotransferase NodH n=1 Tax=Tropicimonas isoalkanivorans TaxID=441112 RepID=A0A1I1DYD2_9RHOB|nr:hypothetical protein [Tropicimonas isoalkanivorans]SFB77720.1 hypothetical protein SAMN04488094_101447 [Tropicimonas isoalkanivorans]
MAWLPHINELVPEVYEHRPVLSMARKGFQNEARLAHWQLHRRRVNRFLIFAQGRTGSTLLTSTLNMHSQVVCDDEILGVPRMFPQNFVENRASDSGAHNFGFHVKIYQLSAWQRVDDVGAFLGSLSARGWKIIYLFRENLVRHAVSNVFAEALGAYHDRGRGGERPRTVYMEPNRLLSDIKLRSRQRTAERTALDGLDHLTLCYERDLEAPDAQKATFTRIQSYLQLQQEDLVPDLRKMVTRPLSDLLQNYEEIQSLLRGRPEARFLDDT